MRKIVAAFSAFVLAVGCLSALSGCRPDYIPDGFGEWDGNYIYKGNVRSKTTGEDGENDGASGVRRGIGWLFVYRKR